MQIRMHRIVDTSFVNGPGKRFVLWVQGCPFNCEGCFNQAARDTEGGTFLSTDEIVQRINIQNVEGITISGGEPFMQALALAELLSKCKKKELNTLVYSGYCYEELKKGSVVGAIELLKEVDLLLDGPFKKDLPSTSEWTGSGNQRAIALSEKGQKMKARRQSHLVEQEYIISPKGELIHTGI